MRGVCNRGKWLRNSAGWAISDPLLRLESAALSLGVIALGSWVMAGLIANMLDARQPLPIQFGERNPATLAARLAGAPLFADQGQGEGRPQAEPSARADGVVLLAVISAKHPDASSRGVAMLRLQGATTPVVLAEGDDVRPGLRLLRVETDTVVLGDPASAVRSEIALHRKKQETGKTAGPAANGGGEKPTPNAKDIKEVRKPIETHDI